MAIKFKMTNEAHVKLQWLLAPLLADAAVSIADECDAQSSWGYYQAGESTFRGRGLGADLPMAYVTALKTESGDARTNRLIRSTVAHSDRFKRAKRSK